MTTIFKPGSRSTAAVSRSAGRVIAPARRGLRSAQKRTHVSMVATAPEDVMKAPIMDKYELMKEDMIEEYGAKVLMFKHKKTGAEVMSVSVPDENKVRCRLCGHDGANTQIACTRGLFKF